jgi:peptide/nickel transport system substrate-binding protein
MPEDKERLPMPEFEEIAGTHLVTRRTFLKASALGAITAAASPMLMGARSARPDARAELLAATPKRGGTLRVGIVGGSSADSLNAENAVYDADICRVIQINETLLSYNPEYEIQPALLESLESSNKERTWTLHLRRGIEFSNGKPFTSSDVVYTLQYVLNPANLASGATRLAALSSTGIKALDAYTVQLKFNSPYSPLADVLAEPGTSAIRVIPAGWNIHHPIGTGPFKFQSFTPGVSSVFVRNNNYWRSGEPYLDELIVLDLTDDTARVNALLSGQVDAIEGVPNSQIPVIKSHSGLQVIDSQTGSWNPITMRTDSAPFDDVRVRQAFRLLVNRPKMVEQVLSNQGAIANDIFGRYDPAYDHSLAQRLQDVKQAKSLLKKAGREDLSVQIVTSPVNIGLVQGAEAFVSQLKSSGIRISLLQVEPTTFFSRYFLNSPLSQSYWATRIYLLQAADSMMPTSPYNETHWKNGQWLKLVQEAYATPTGSKQTELIHAAQKIEWDEGGYINWGWYNIVDAAKKKVKGLVPDRSGFALTTFGFRRVWLQ